MRPPFLIALLRRGLPPALAFTAAGFVPAAEVRLERSPEGGLAPQVLLDAEGALHLFYFKGDDPRAGDLFYARRAPGAKAFSPPVQVNHLAGSVTASGSIRGAQAALGRHARLHVVWNGSTPGPHGAPMFYSRLDPATGAFEPERNLITWAWGLDGGGAIAADAEGRVFVFWHALAGAEGEAGRSVFLARSGDEGATFAPEERISPEAAGACGCCGMRATVDERGRILALFRAATNGLGRDTVLLHSRGPAAPFELSRLHAWRSDRCPMSSFALFPTPNGTLAAWETAGNVFFTRLSAAEPESPAVIPAPERKLGRKHPLLLSNALGETLLAWVEGSGWQRGGGLAWRLFTASGEPTDRTGRAEGVPANSLLAGYVEPDGDFVIIY